ncbi:unnamed protein product [Didymodactylos carnosus]|uniref:Pseudouridine synthase II N-terminal domain-containing protein n=1 Tax=Didymodactylos carnosus TaxID=1234261 RepID=A0A813UHX4_9BILA|nr:unnamed protein product [Didymodactylos carnosus]CAF3616410.1 unnamed protein product [Didymodactylos carnosus]
MLRSPAELLFEKLSGIVCLFKPADMRLQNFLPIVQARLATAFNDMPCRPPDQRVDIICDTRTGKELVKTSLDLADTVQALGPRYLAEDFEFTSILPLRRFSSGVQILAINDNSRKLKDIEDGQPIRSYLLKGKFGESTDTLDANGVIVEKSRYKHISTSKIEQVLALIQNSFQATMYKLSGISPFTQAGYDLAKVGLWKPRDHTLPPIVYGLKLLEYKPPYFKIEIHALNEDEIHLKEVVVDIGVRLRTSSVSESVRRTNIGPFKVEHALSLDEITPETLLENMKNSERLIEEANLLDKTILIGKSHNEEVKIVGRKPYDNVTDIYQTKKSAYKTSEQMDL